MEGRHSLGGARALCSGQSIYFPHLDLKQLSGRTSLTAARRAMKKSPSAGGSEGPPLHRARHSCSPGRGRVAPGQHSAGSG